MTPKIVLTEVELKYEFGKAGVFAIRGIPRAFGISSNGRKWFSLLRPKTVERREGSKIVKQFIYIEESFSFDRVVEGKELLEKYYEGLK